MNEQTAIVQAERNLFIAPVTDMNTALSAYQSMKDFVSKVLRKDVDYGAVPGTDKPTLFKPGSEKLARFFGLSLMLHQVQTIEDWTGASHNGEPMFFYRYKAQACRGELVIAEGIGSCSSWEKKYRYRNAQRVCPACGQPTIIKGKPEYGGGWLCYARKGGCGEKYAINAPEIVNQEVGQTANPDPADIVNTVDKMAQKRAIIAAVLLACNASEYFTQDIEDYIDGSFEDTHTEPSKPAPQPIKHPEPHKTNGREPDASLMPLEDAEAIENSEGIRYGDLPTDKLAFMANSITKAAKKSDLSDEDAAEYDLKSQAIRSILANRYATKQK